MAGADEFVVDFPTLFLAADWTEAHCVVPDGFQQGQPFGLLDWQAWCLLNFYRLKPTVLFNPYNPVLAPAFYWRRSQIMLPQKAGKGPYTAAHCCLEAVGPALFAGWAEGGEVYDCRDHGCGCGWSYEYEPGEAMGMPWPTPLIQVTAYSEDQTDNVYNWLRPMIDMGPLSDVIRKTGVESIRLPGGGRIDVVASSAQSRLGNPTTFAPQDETGIWTPANKMDKLARTQRRGLAGMGGRAEETTNGYNPTEDSVAQQTAQSSSKDIFRYHPQAPAHLSYTDKRERRRIHQFVYGGSLRENGGHIDLDAIEAEAFEMLERDPFEAERFFGNRCKSGTATWLKDGLWKSREVKPARVLDDRISICLGFDGSESDDWTAFRAETMDGYGFTPTYGPDSLPTVWDPKLFGDRIPRDEVNAALDELNRRYRLVRVYCDPQDWQTDIEAWALKYGAKVVFEWATNRITAMHESLKRMVTDLTTEAYSHDGCTTAELHVGNTRKLAKPGQRYILGKASQVQKIDVAMSAVLAHEARCDAVAAGEGRTQGRRKVVVM